MARSSWNPRWSYNDRIVKALTEIARASAAVEQHAWSPLVEEEIRFRARLRSTHFSAIPRTAAATCFDSILPPDSLGFLKLAPRSRNFASHPPDPYDPPFRIGPELVAPARQGCVVTKNQD